VTEAFQAYINMVTGVTKTTQAKAVATARAMLKQAGLDDMATEASERVTKLAEEIIDASRTNRELLQNFVTAEVDKAAARLGFARAEEVEALRDEIASLRTQLNEAILRAARAEATKKTATTKTATKKAATKKAATQKAPAKKTAATMTGTKKSATTKSSERRPPRKSAATAQNPSQSSQP
jgi:predicted metal-binding transcription factor (methanogenesis marker protein 9)